MFIKWLGHSCFLLTSGSGVRVLTDPYDPYVGFSMPPVEADIVTTSHKHKDHCYLQGVKGDFTHIGEPGGYDMKNIRVTGVPTFHDDAEGTKRGSNTIFVFEMDGLRICHCGDLGHIPTEGQKEAIGRVNVLMVPVGSVYTLDAAGAAETVKILDPDITIPMHFKTSELSFGLDKVDKFLTAAGGGMRLGKQEIEVTEENLGSLPRIIVLENCD